MDTSIWAHVSLNLFGGKLSMHQVPRELFDLIPGTVRECAGRDGTFWTKDMMLAGQPGKHVTLTVYCCEPPLSGSQPDELLERNVAAEIRSGAA